MPGKEPIFFLRQRKLQKVRSNIWEIRLNSSNMNAEWTENNEKVATPEGVFAAPVQENRAPKVQLLSEPPPPAYNSLGFSSQEKNFRPICRNYARGNCNSGSDCKFYHPAHFRQLDQPAPHSFFHIDAQLINCTDNEIPEFLKHELCQVKLIRRFFSESSPNMRHLYAIDASTEMSSDSKVGRSKYREADVKIGGLNLDFGPAVIVNLFQLITGLKVVLIDPQKDIAGLWVTVPNAKSTAERETALQEACNKFKTNMVLMMPYSAKPVAALLATDEIGFSIISSKMERCLRTDGAKFFPRHAMTATKWIPNALLQRQYAGNMSNACAIATLVNDSSNHKSDSNPIPEQQTDICSASKKHTHNPYR